MKSLLLDSLRSAQLNAGLGNIRKQLLAMSLLMISPSVSAEVSSQLLVLSCRNCHSSSTQDIPKLDSLTFEQIQQALLDFKSDRRKSTVMGRLAKGFSNSEIQAVAAQVVKNRRR